MASLTVGAAVANPLNFYGNKTTTAQASQAATASTPELDAAAQKCDQLHAKLEQARKQLDAAKANLKAAESELKAARAEKEALGLRTEATELASKAAVDPIIGSGQTTNGLGVNAEAPTVHNIESTTTTTTTSTSSPVPGATAAPPTLQDLAPSN
ncbi:MAG: hypothetical protein KGS72_09585 [Cyanobacteria bacterium REEB67]|nr:hypothetical protein [Cyanobacteria bacterium REEB67]